ncbi:MAG: S1C family serine protease [Planctomycetota bacterium]|jgi:S1-C subfamily serine protease
MNTDDNKLKLIVFKACHVAVWSDAKMTTDERRYLSYLTEALCKSEAERKTFREIRLQEINEGLLLSEIEPLSEEEKTYVFDTCLETLASDKKINLQELRFLVTLQKACGIKNRTYRKKIAQTCRKTKARIFPSKLIILLLLVFYILLIVAIYMGYRGGIDTKLREECSGKEISVSILSPNEQATSQISSSQEVFDKVRDGIVSIHVFINYDPVWGGSGSVIGTDENGMIYIITNRHVIENLDTNKKGKKSDRVRVEVQQHSGAKFEATLDFYSRKYDLALLAVKGMKDYAKPLHINLKSTLHVGQPVYAIGSPLGLDHSFTAGVISALRDTYLQTDATVHSGSSGGPLIDQYGSLCAVVTKGHVTKDYGFALYSDIILEVLEERKKVKIDTSLNHP